MARVETYRDCDASDVDLWEMGDGSVLFFFLSGAEDAPFWSHLYGKTINLPRQAGQNLGKAEKRGVFGRESGQPHLLRTWALRWDDGGVVRIAVLARPR